MRVILLGSTGYIGKEVLNQCLKTPAITSIVALSRRQLPQLAKDPRVTVVIIENFKIYPDSVLEQLKDADACIWSIGTYNGDPVVELEYPKAFQQALLNVLSPTRKFRYVYLGGGLTEPNQEKSLWFLSGGRQGRGLAQTEFLEFANNNQNIEDYVVRPGAVLSAGLNASLTRLISKFAVKSDELGIVMADLAVNGGGEQVMLNIDIVEKGRALLDRRNKGDSKTGNGTDV